MSVWQLGGGGACSVQRSATGNGGACSVQRRCQFGNLVVAVLAQPNEVQLYPTPSTPMTMGEAVHTFETVSTTMSSSLVRGRGIPVQASNATYSQKLADREQLGQSQVDSLVTAVLAQSSGGVSLAVW